MVRLKGPTSKLITAPGPRSAHDKSSNRRSLIIIVTVGLIITLTYLNFAPTSQSSFLGAIDAMKTTDGNEKTTLRLEVEPTETKSNNSNMASYNDPAFEMNSIPAPDFHLVVSTGCSTYQDWQSYALFYHSMKSGQVKSSSPSENINNQHDDGLSYVTRVVSGCTSEQSAMMNQHHAKYIAPIAPGRFFIHHTPDYQFMKPNLDYKFFNKPLGYQHWLVNALRYPYNHEKYDNVTYVLLDPDQIILRKFGNDYTTERERWGGPFQDKRIVQQGQPFAQEYAMGVEFLMKMKSQMKNIAPVNEQPSALESLSREDAFAYQLGPPYIMKGIDLWKIVNKWSDFVPYVVDQQPDHLSEMYAYSAAAAHLQLPHQVVQSFMVSNADVQNGEGWDLIEGKPDEDVCSNVPVQEMPHVIHYCQNYGVGKYFFSKYTFPGDFISCNSPLLKEPPRNVATMFNHMIDAWDGKRREFKNQALLRRMTFAVCHMIKSMNEAAVYYKEQHCAPSTANYNRTLAFFDNMESD